MIIAGTNIFYVLALILLQPYKENSTNVMKITGEMFFTISTILMVIFAVFKGELNEENYKLIGDVCTICLLLS